MQKLEMWMRAETGGSDESGNWRYKTGDWRLETRMQTMMTRAERNDVDDKGRKQR